MSSVGEQLLDVPIDEMIKSMAVGIAEAQYNLDKTCIKIAQMMSGTDEDDKIDFGNNTYSLLELGFTPTFYQFVDTLIEVKMSITMTRAQSYKSSSKVKWKYKAVGASVNADYANRYSYSVEGSSVLRTKLVPVPAPSILEERIRAIIEEETSTPIDE